MYEYKIDDGEEFTLYKNYETKEDFVNGIAYIKKKIVYEIEFKDGDIVRIIKENNEIDFKNFKLTKKKVKQYESYDFTKEVFSFLKK